MSDNLQLVSMQRILAGLIHNINTPLNLIMGYSQQLQLTQGDSPYLQKIMDAGIKIDDLLSGILDNIHEKTYAPVKEVDILKWLSSEVAFLQNELSIKRKIVFKISRSQEQMLVSTSVPLLSTVFEALVLNYRDSLGEYSGSINIYSVSEQNSVDIRIVCALPVGSCVANTTYELLPDPIQLKTEIIGIDAEKYLAFGTGELSSDGRELNLSIKVLNVYE